MTNQGGNGNSQFDFFLDPLRKIPKLQSDGSIKWSEAIQTFEDQDLCLATSVKQFSGGIDHPVTVTLAQMPAFDNLNREQQAQVTDESAYASRVTDSAKVVTAAWDYENGLLVAQPQKVYKYVHGGVTYWGSYYYENRLHEIDLPASRTGIAASMATETATAAAGADAKKNGDTGNASATTSSETVPSPSSSPTSAGHQSLKLSGVLCASVMGLGFFLSGSGLW